MATRLARLAPSLNYCHNNTSRIICLSSAASLMSESSPRVDGVVFYIICHSNRTRIAGKEVVGWIFMDLRLLISLDSVDG